MDSDGGLHTTILRISKAVHREAAPMLYGRSTWFIRTFLVDKKLYMPEQLAHIGTTNAGLIRRVLTLFPTQCPGKDFDTDENLQEKYEAMGIEWTELQLWTTKVNAEFPKPSEDRRSIMEFGPDSPLVHAAESEWAVIADAAEIERLVAKTNWWTNDLHGWIVENGVRL